MCAHIPAKLLYSRSPPAGMLDKDKAELLPVEKVNPMNLSLEMLQVVHLTQVYRAHWTQTSLPAWPVENKQLPLCFTFLFCSYILPLICYSAGQAKTVWMSNRSY